MSVSTHVGSSESAPSYRSEVPSSSGSLADSVSTRTVSLLSSPPSYRFAPLPPLPASPPPSLVTAPDYAVHYRIYTPSGAVLVKAAASRPDPFVGRILARSVPPPHLAGMLKRRILAAEGLPDRTISVEGTPPPRRLSQIFSPPRSVSVPYSSYPFRSSPPSPSPPSLYQSITSTNGTQIFASMYDSEPMTDDVAVLLTGDGRRGASSDNPLAIVFLKELSVEERNARGKVEDFASREIPLDRYVYYRLYNQDGETRSSAAFDSVHTALGRIERAHITPPTTVDSLKSCIAKVEHKRIWKYADLYEGTAPCDPLGGSGSVGRHMGGDLNSPLLLVQPERTSGLFNRPARMLKTRKYRQSEKLTYDILQGTMMLTDGVVKDSMCACLVPGRAERAMLKRKWFELLDE
ncbi:hypothetical protein B0H16DRAFT_1726972 [Mycena metata]|uniref:Uncharacterized protein n=1 Tax=Mycena metata TaxID=1033252 RepID=A0AAD7HTM9_9AGAR|nr:hypothetical protein B0H16DRAFT_1734876 [Mycena metata]KAJ7745081.1 hypothetical protein B0H16DRAFT_1726972 [Mycena metata]